MPWEPEHNRNSLSPHGNKTREGFAARGVHDLNSVPGPDIPRAGVCGAPLNSDPHGRGDRASPYIAELAPAAWQSGIDDATTHSAAASRCRGSWPARKRGCDTEITTMMTSLPPC